MGKFDVARGRVGRKHGGCGDDVWFGNFVEQVAGVGDVEGFAVMIDEAVDDEREWLEAGGEDVSVDGTCEGSG